MIYTSLTIKAMQIAYSAHKGQVDKCGVPYIFHPFHVAEQMGDELSTCIGLLHDIVEDTEISFDDLRKQGFPQEVIYPLMLLTRSKDEKYFDYIKKIRESEIAVKVKLADLDHNLDESRYHIKESLRKRYLKAKEILTLDNVIKTKGEISMNKMLTAMKTQENISRTENGAVTRRSTLNGLLDLFALGGAYRSRSEEDCITLFKKAFKEDPIYAMKCLFYLRDARGGQGERRFFRVICKWMALYEPDAIRRNMEYIPEFGRWDDLYVFVDTPLEKEAFRLMYRQLALDVNSKTPSLLAKWLKSENTSSGESKRLANKTRIAFNMTPRQYRKTLSHLREKLKVVERLMSQNRWDEIEFDKIPSRAGIIYRNAFAYKDITRARYETFAKSENTKVNANVLYPYDIACRIFSNVRLPFDSPERLMLQKYWDNLPNFYGDREENGIAVVDVSGSMIGAPLEAAVSMGAYIAEKSHGPFANHFITFSGNPHLVQFEGADITDKFINCIKADWGMNTNLEAVFNLLLNTAIKNECSVKDMPERIYIFSDMEFDKGCISYGPISNNRYNNNCCSSSAEIETLMEKIARQWEKYGYKLPSVIFWNLNARHDNIPAIGEGFSYVSGFSPVMIETILSGKDGVDLMLEKLNSERYSHIL